MKGEIKMDTSNNENVTLDGARMSYTVLRIQEDKDDGKVEIDISATFDNISDAKKFKDAKDSIERLTPRYTWKATQYKIQQVFYKSFVQDALAS